MSRIQSLWPRLFSCLVTSPFLYDVFPPNLLIGEGAKEFARESGMLLVPNQFLVSRNARDRYVRWQEDMRRAEGKASLSLAHNTYDRALDDHGSEIRQNVHPDHTTAILTGTWNEGQPDSPALPSSPWDNGPSMLLKLNSAQVFTQDPR